MTDHCDTTQIGTMANFLDNVTHTLPVRVGEEGKGYYDYRQFDARKTRPNGNSSSTFSQAVWDVVNHEQRIILIVTKNEFATSMLLLETISAGLECYGRQSCQGLETDTAEESHLPEPC